MKINLNGRYKSLANYVTLRRNKDGVIIARNALIDEEIDITERQARYLTKLNGDRNPKKIPGYSYEECYRYYHLFDDMLMLRKPGRCQSFGFSLLYTLFIPQRLRKAKTVLHRILNFLLYISCIPVFVAGIINYINALYRMEYEHILLGYGVGLLIGITAHELSHANACLAYNGLWLEFGVMWSGLSMGAYVMLDTSKIKKRLRKAQVNLAGAEMNLLLAGIFFMLASRWGIWSSGLGEFTGVFFYAGFENVFLALLNMTFFKGLDGEHVISNLLGKESVVEDAKRNILAMLNFRERKRYWEEYGITNGLAGICSDLLILCSQLVLPLLILSDIAVIVGGIFAEEITQELPEHGYYVEKFNLGYFVAVIVLILLIVKLMPFTKSFESTWVFLLTFIAFLPMNIRIARFLAGILISYSNGFARGIWCVVLGFTLLSVEEIMMGLIARFIWKKQKEFKSEKERSYLQFCKEFDESEYGELE